MATKTQKEIVVEKLITEGHVSNVWAFQNYILRLGALIHGLRQDGWVIDTSMEGPNHNQAVYTLKSRPEAKLF